MRFALIVAISLLPATAVAQQRAAGIVSNGTFNGNYIEDHGNRYIGDDALSASIRRVEDWSRCVVGTEPAGVADFLSARGVARSRLEWSLKPIFYTCARQVGARTLFMTDAVRSAALRDTLRNANAS